jgi:hypothetical protein
LPSRAASRRHLFFPPSASSDDDVKHIEFASKVQLLYGHTHFNEISAIASTQSTQNRFSLRVLQVKRVGEGDLDESAQRKKRLEL